MSKSHTGHICVPTKYTGTVKEGVDVSADAAASDEKGYLVSDLGDPVIVGLLAPRLNNGNLKDAAIRARVRHIVHCDSGTTGHPT